MKILLIAALAALLTACSSNMPLESKSRNTFSGFATLAEFGTFEMELAPAYTRLAVLRHNAALALEKWHISVSVAKGIQADADAVRAKLDRARTLDASKSTDAAKALLAEAAQDISSLEKKLP